MPNQAPGFDAAQDGKRSRFSFANIDPIRGVRYLFTFDATLRERRVESGSITGHAVGGDYVSEDYQRVAGSYIVDAVLATPLDAMPSAAGLEQYWAAADADPVPLRRVPLESLKTWDARASDMEFYLDLVRGSLLEASFARHEHRFNLVLTGYSDVRDKKLRSELTLTFEHLRQATSRRVLVPTVPRVNQQLTPAQQAAADLDLNIGSQNDQGTLAFARLGGLFPIQSTPQGTNAQARRVQQQHLAFSQGNFASKAVLVTP